MQMSRVLGVTKEMRSQRVGPAMTTNPCLLRNTLLGRRCTVLQIVVGTGYGWSVDSVGRGVGFNTMGSLQRSVTVYSGLLVWTRDNSW